MAKIEHRLIPLADIPENAGRVPDRSPVRLYPGDVVDGVTVAGVDGTLIDCDLMADDGTAHHVRTIFARRSDHGEKAHQEALDAWLAKELARWNAIPTSERGPAKHSALAMRTAAKQHLAKAAEMVATAAEDGEAPIEE